MGSLCRPERSEGPIDLDDIRENRRIQMKFIFFTLIFIFSFNSHADLSCGKKKKLFHISMPIFIGDKIFNDEVVVCKKGSELSGQLNVPKRFTANLENIQYSGNNLSFSITANEGRGKFQVFYSGELKESNKYFMGMARLKDNKLLGPFVGLIQPRKVKFELIQ